MALSPGTFFCGAFWNCDFWEDAWEWVDHDRQNNNNKKLALAHFVRLNNSSIIFPFFLSLKNQIQKDVENVQTEFRRLGDILDSEEKNELQKLTQEREDILSILAESESKHAQQSKLLGDLISDVEHQLQCSAMEMLQVRLQEVGI